MLDKLDAAIDKFLKADGTNRQRGSAKGQITKIVNDLGKKWAPDEVRKMALALVKEKEYVPKRTEILKNRFTFGSLYQEGDRVFGWWEDGKVQIQAEELPLCRSEGAYVISFYGRAEEVGVWLMTGFEPAEPLPAHRTNNGLIVEFNISRLELLVEHGWALPCELPWRRGEFDQDVSCLWVSRSIIGAGWWCAYKWWEGCRWWYLIKHPEWFTDDPLWGDWEAKPVYYYAPEPDSAVLGGGSNS